MDLERDVPELRRGAGRRWRSSGLAEAQGVDEASQCVKDRLGPGTGGRSVLAHWMAGDLAGRGWAHSLGPGEAD